MEFDVSKLWDAFLTWQFLIASLAIVAVIHTAKKSLRAANPKLLEKHWVAALLTSANLILGALVAIPKGYLAGATYGQRLLTGIVAGFVSNFLYHLVLKKLGFFKDKESRALLEKEDAEALAPEETKSSGKPTDQGAGT